MAGSTSELTVPLVCLYQCHFNMIIALLVTVTNQPLFKSQSHHYQFSKQYLEPSWCPSKTTQSFLSCFLICCDQNQAGGSVMSRILKSWSLFSLNCGSSLLYSNSPAHWCSSCSPRWHKSVLLLPHKSEGDNFMVRASAATSH